MLAFQVSFPCPFYLYDGMCDRSYVHLLLQGTHISTLATEIDAALDTVNVAKLGSLLRSQSLDAGTQFLVVSHRPEMWNLCASLVGVFERNGSAHTVACQFGLDPHQDQVSKRLE